MKRFSAAAAKRQPRMGAAARMKTTLRDKINAMNYDQWVIASATTGSVLGSWVGAYFGYRDHKRDAYTECVVSCMASGWLGALSGFMVGFACPVAIPLAIPILIGTTIARQLEPAVPAVPAGTRQTEYDLSQPGEEF